MMNISSNRYQIRSTGIGGFTVTDLQTNESKYVPSAPDAGTLAAITEKQFDKEMANLLGN